MARPAVFALLLLLGATAPAAPGEAGKPAAPGKPPDVPPVEATAEPPMTDGSAAEGTAMDGKPPPSLTGQALRDELRAGTKMQELQRQEIGRLRAELAEEKKKLEAMAAEIAAARAALRSETQQLERLSKRPLPSGAVPGAPPTAVETMSKALKAMKPAESAELISRMETELAVEILTRLKPAESGAILAKMKPEKAAALVASVAARDREEEEP